MMNHQHDNTCGEKIVDSLATWQYKILIKNFSCITIVMYFELHQ